MKINQNVGTKYLVILFKIKKILSEYQNKNGLFNHNNLVVINIKNRKFIKLKFLTNTELKLILLKMRCH